MFESIYNIAKDENVEKTNKSKKDYFCLHFQSDKYLQ